MRYDASSDLYNVGEKGDSPTGRRKLDECEVGRMSRRIHLSVSISLLAKKLVGKNYFKVKNKCNNFES